MIIDDKYNILIIDDRPENLIALESILDDPKIQLIKAESGLKALELVLKYEFALILADVVMPDMDGYETAELLRGKAESKQIPIIFITAINKELKFVFKGYEAGAVDYLIKPFEPEILKSKVKVFIQLFQQQKIIEQQAEHLRQKITKLNETYEELEKKEKAQEELIEELQHALSEVKKLSGLIPICASCKKVRDDEGYWGAVESYISSRSEAQFSHGICPECIKKDFSDIKE